ncbi:hypothetical protein DRW03_34445 [Corallococcus sp. H22C18031201]|nr:hypothetical protein DRW03_34445 [Corallococcus sp. H22C18031201]
MRSVSPHEVIIEDAGTRLPMGVWPETRILRGGQSIEVQQLKVGEQVRAVVNLVGHNQTEEIAVLPRPPPKRSER